DGRAEPLAAWRTRDALQAAGGQLLARVGIASAVGSGGGEGHSEGCALQAGFRRTVDCVCAEPRFGDNASNGRERPMGVCGILAPSMPGGGDEVMTDGRALPLLRVE